MNVYKLRRYLMLVGLIPFMAGAMAILLDVESWWLINDVETSFALYCLAIASFMAGVYWGVAHTTPSATHLLTLSNLMVVLPWIAFAVLGSGSVFYAVLAYVFLRQLLLDRKLRHQGVFDAQYLRDRFSIAVPVSVLMLIIVGFKLF